MTCEIPFLNLSYSISITDSNGCVIIISPLFITYETGIFTVLPSPLYMINPTCENNNDGSLLIGSIQGGELPYTLNWTSDNGFNETYEWNGDNLLPGGSPGDIDGDGKVGDTISAVYMDVPDADTGVENPKDNFGLYKTASGSYIADTAGLAVGDQTNEPTLLVKQTVFRGQTSTSLYDFKYTPTGAVAYTEGGGSVYYQDTKGKWFRDNFSDDGVFQTTDSLTLSEVRNEEAVHDLDLDGDGNVGDTIAEIYFNVPDSNVEVDDLKDNWGLSYHTFIMSCRKDDWIDSVKILIENGADVNASRRQRRWRYRAHADRRDD